MALLELIQAILARRGQVVSEHDTKPLAYQALEPRLLLDAAALATWAENSEDQYYSSLPDEAERALDRAIADLPQETTAGSVQLYIVDNSISGTSSLLRNIGDNGYSESRSDTGSNRVD